MPRKREVVRGTHLFRVREQGQEQPRAPHRVHAHEGQDLRGGGPGRGRARVQVRARSSSSRRSCCPGYLLVRMELDDDSWYVVRNTPGVTGFVGTSARPTPISLDEVDRVLARQKAEKPKVSAEFSEGEGVKVVEGPFADFTGDHQRGEPRPEQAEGAGLDIRARDPGRADVRPGHQAVRRSGEQWPRK